MFDEDYHIVVLSHGKYLVEHVIVPTIENEEGTLYSGKF